MRYFSSISIRPLSHPQNEVIISFILHDELHKNPNRNPKGNCIFVPLHPTKYFFWFPNTYFLPFVPEFVLTYIQQVSLQQRTDRKEYESGIRLHRVCLLSVTMEMHRSAQSCIPKIIGVFLIEYEFSHHQTMVSPEFSFLGEYMTPVVTKGCATPNMCDSSLLPLLQNLKNAKVQCCNESLCNQQFSEDAP